jgi:hypothetical protein
MLTNTSASALASAFDAFFTIPPAPPWMRWLSSNDSARYPLDFEHQQFQMTW